MNKSIILNLKHNNKNKEIRLDANELLKAAINNKINKAKDSSNNIIEDLKLKAFKAFDIINVDKLNDNNALNLILKKYDIYYDNKLLKANSFYKILQTKNKVSNYINQNLFNTNAEDYNELDKSLNKSLFSKKVEKSINKFCFSTTDIYKTKENKLNESLLNENNNPYILKDNELDNVDGNNFSDLKNIYSCDNIDNTENKDQTKNIKNNWLKIPYVFELKPRLENNDDSEIISDINKSNNENSYKLAKHLSNNSDIGKFTISDIKNNFLECNDNIQKFNKNDSKLVPRDSNNSNFNINTNTLIINNSTSSNFNNKHNNSKNNAFKNSVYNDPKHVNFRNNYFNKSTSLELINLDNNKVKNNNIYNADNANNISELNNLYNKTANSSQYVSCINVNKNPNTNAEIVDIKEDNIIDLEEGNYYNLILITIPNEDISLSQSLFTNFVNTYLFFSNTSYFKDNIVSFKEYNEAFTILPLLLTNRSEIIRIKKLNVNMYINNCLTYINILKNEDNNSYVTIDNHSIKKMIGTRKLKNNYIYNNNNGKKKLSNNTDNKNTKNLLKMNSFISSNNKNNNSNNVKSVLENYSFSLNLKPKESRLIKFIVPSCIIDHMYTLELRTYDEAVLKKQQCVIESEKKQLNVRNINNDNTKDDKIKKLLNNDLNKYIKTDHYGKRYVTIGTVVDKVSYVKNNISALLINYKNIVLSAIQEINQFLNINLKLAYYLYIISFIFLILIIFIDKTSSQFVNYEFTDYFLIGQCLWILLSLFISLSSSYYSRLACFLVWSFSSCYIIECFFFNIYDSYVSMINYYLNNEFMTLGWVVLFYFCQFFISFTSYVKMIT